LYLFHFFLPKNPFFPFAGAVAVVYFLTLILTYLGGLEGLSGTASTTTGA
tara:strand:+ start:63 stop:212 length:150 start_codon:yes stop_codon:yes gene_type:complete